MMRKVMAVKSKEMRLLRSSKFWEVNKYQNTKKKNIENSVNISSFRKPVLSVAVQVVSSATGYVGENGNIVYLISHTMRFFVIP
jgi:hypothetical protein